MFFLCRSICQRHQVAIRHSKSCRIRRTATHIAHCIVIAQRGVGGNVEQFFFAHSRIEHQHASTIPVAIDIFRTHVAHTRCFVINHTIRNRVARKRTIHTCHNALLTRSIVAIIVNTEVVVPRRF